MTRLVLVRHGIAEDPAPGQADRERALTGPGRERVAAVAADLAQVLGPVAMLVSSDLLRARETAEILATELNPHSRDVFPGLAPQGEPAGVYQWLERSDTTGTTVLVGHEPQMNALLGLGLTGQPVAVARFRKAAVALLEFAGPITPGGGRLEAFVPPAVAMGVRPR